MTASINRDLLLSVLLETSALLARPGNDFVWSEWADATEALAQLQVAISALERGEPIDIGALRLWFAPTGSIQEVSVSSGWGEAFIEVSSRFDRSIGDQ